MSLLDAADERRVEKAFLQRGKPFLRPERVRSRIRAISRIDRFGNHPAHGRSPTKAAIQRLTAGTLARHKRVVNGNEWLTTYGH
jgi:hypothetical protein